MNVWAIVAHYGAVEATAATLASLRAGTRPPDTVLVIDNQGDFEDLEAEVVRPGTNIGFTAAVALGTERGLAGGADWLWFFNNDAFAGERCLEELLEAAAGAPRAGMLSPVIRYPDGGVWFAGGNVDLRTVGTAHVQVDPQATRPFATQYVTGCAMLVAAAMVADCGPPDVSLFMYYEDVDWSLRARDHGWETLVVPAAEVVHDVPRHRGRRRFSPGSVYYLTRNRLLLAHRVGSVRAALLPTSGWALRQVVKAASWGGSRATTRAAVRGLVDGVKGRDGAMPAALAERLS